MNTSSQNQPPDPTPDQRERLMAATSVQEQLVATLPEAALPDRIGTYDTHPQWPLETVGLELRYMGRPDAADAVRAFAEVVGVRARVQHVISGQDGHPYLMISAEGTYSGTHVYAWTSADDPAHTTPAPTEDKPDLIHVPAATPARPVTPQPLTVKAAANAEQTMPITPQTTGTEGGERW